MSDFALRSFAGGEISPECYSRTDQTKYATGLRTCRNFVVQRHGGVQYRPGTTYVATVKDSTTAVRLIEFIFNDSQTYVLEFGDQYVRFYQNGGAVVVGTPDAWLTATTYNEGEVVSNGGDNYVATATYVSDAATEPGVGGSWATKWNLLSGDIYEIPSPYAAADLALVQYVQSGDVLTIVHPSYAPYDLKRLGNTYWQLDARTFATSVATLGALGLAGGTAGVATYYAVTQVDTETQEESLLSFGGSNIVPSATVPITVTWSGGTTGLYYVYRSTDAATWGFIGAALAETFDDYNNVLDYTQTPPISNRDPFSSTDNYPAAVAYYQQRILFAGTNNRPSSIWASKTGLPYNFNTSLPLADDDPITVTLYGQKSSAVRHLIDLGRLVAFTSAGETVIEGDDAGILRLTAVNPRQFTAHGSTALCAPIMVDTSALYVQARGSIVRDLQPDAIEGYKGNDLTIFSSHLFEGHTIVSWAYQKIPNSVIWAVRDDGVLLALTYLKAQAVWGWHRHDTDGFVLGVCAVPEGTEDRLYILVERTIDGNSVQYIEEMEPVYTAALVDMAFVDCALHYDGRNSTATTMTLSGGTDWDESETLTLTASASFFISGDVGNQIVFTADDGGPCRCTITAYTSGTVVTVRPTRTVPAELRSAATAVWARAVDAIAGLDHLEGKDLSILGDGFVVANPNDAALVTVSVASGSAALDRCYSVLHAGLPYLGDLETLDIDSPQSMTLKGRSVIVGSVLVSLKESQGFYAGMALPDDLTPLDTLLEYKIRDVDAGYDDPPALATETVQLRIESNWDSNGRVAIRQINPLPLAITMIAPQLQGTPSTAAQGAS